MKAFRCLEVFVINIWRTSSPPFLSLKKEWQTSKGSNFIWSQKIKVHKFSLCDSSMKSVNVWTFTCHTGQDISFMVLKGGLWAPEGAQTDCLCFAVVACGSLLYAYSPGDPREDQGGYILWSPCRITEEVPTDFLFLVSHRAEHPGLWRRHTKHLTQGLMYLRRANSHKVRMKRSYSFI